MSLIREESLKTTGGEISDLGMQGLNIELHGHSLADVICFAVDGTPPAIALSCEKVLHLGAGNPPR
jgi:hypothetical protein